MAWCFVGSATAQWRENSMALDVMTNERWAWTSATSHYLNKKIKLKLSHTLPPVKPISSNSYDRHETRIWCNHPRLHHCGNECAVSQRDPSIFWRNRREADAREAGEKVVQGHLKGQSMVLSTFCSCVHPFAALNPPFVLRYFPLFDLPNAPTPKKVGEN